MTEDIFRNLRSEDAVRIKVGLEGLAVQFQSLEDAIFGQAVQAVIGLFYADIIDHPELVPLLERAEEILAAQGERAVPVVLAALGESDLKAHFWLASTLGRMGSCAVDALFEACEAPADDYCRVFALYALGKVKDPAVARALPLLFLALDDNSPEVRDTAARTIGKVFESATPDQFTEAVTREAFDRLLAGASDPYAGVRSKSIRSLGKLARRGLLAPGERQRLKVLVTRSLGEDDDANWDPAYVVRAEAEKVRDLL
jgi:HEAT repeat protein